MLMFFFFALQSSKLEEALTLQLQGLRDQCNLKKSSLQDHQSSLEVLKEEVSSGASFFFYIMLFYVLFKYILRLSNV